LFLKKKNDNTYNGVLQGVVSNEKGLKEAEKRRKCGGEHG
jgi:hypothetical protein